MKAVGEDLRDSQDVPENVWNFVTRRFVELLQERLDGADASEDDRFRLVRRQLPLKSPKSKKRELRGAHAHKCAQLHVEKCVTAVGPSCKKLDRYGLCCITSRSA